MTDDTEEKVRQWKKTQRLTYYGGTALTLAGLGMATLSAWTSLDLELGGMVVLLVAIILFQLESKATIWLFGNAIRKRGEDL